MRESSHPELFLLQLVYSGTSDKGHNKKLYTLEGPENSLSYDVSLASEERTASLCTDKMAGPNMSFSLRLFAIVHPPPHLPQAWLVKQQGASNQNNNYPYISIEPLDLAFCNEGPL